MKITDIIKIDLENTERTYIVTDRFFRDDIALFAGYNSVWRPILTGELYLSIRSGNHSQIIIRVVHAVTGSTVTNFKIDYLGISTVDQMVRITDTRPETGAHSRRQLCFPLIGDKYRIP